MFDRQFRFCLVALVGSAAFMSVAEAQSPSGTTFPRTPWNTPEFSGVWSNASLTQLTRDRGVEKLVVSEEEAQEIILARGGLRADKSWNKARFSDPEAGAPEKGEDDFGVKGYDSFWLSSGDTFARVKGELRSSYIVEPANGQPPYRDPEKVQKEQAQRARDYALGNADYDGPEATTISERCLIGFSNTGGPGMLSAGYNNNYQFVQTRDHLMILVEMAHDARIIPIFATEREAKASHKPAAITPWLGDSVAWWEGDTLVSETTGVNPKQGAVSAFRVSPTGKVTERFTRINGQEIFYEFIVDDPVYYTAPWKAELSFHPQSRVYEYACHEGNYGLEGILMGARLQDRQ